jgi:hypothetical protein
MEKNEGQGDEKNGRGGVDGLKGRTEKKLDNRPEESLFSGNGIELLEEGGTRFQIREAVEGFPGITKGGQQRSAGRTGREMDIEIVPLLGSQFPLQVGG